MYKKKIDYYGYFIKTKKKTLYIFNENEKALKCKLMEILKKKM